jgi:hypothetical protein
LACRALRNRLSAQFSSLTANSEYRAEGIETVVFGDLFLEDVRACREQFLARHCMRGQHPTRASAVFARVVNGYLEVYETMRRSKKLTLRALMGREK